MIFIASFFIGAGEITAALKGSKLTSVLTKFSKLFKYARNKTGLIFTKTKILKTGDEILFKILDDDKIEILKHLPDNIQSYTTIESSIIDDAVHVLPDGTEITGKCDIVEYNGQKYVKVTNVGDEINNLLIKGIKNLNPDELLIVIKGTSTKITDKSIITKILDATTANYEFTGQQINRFGFLVDLNKINPPHANIPNIGVNDFKLLEKKYFIRVSNSTNTSHGEWLISLEDFKKFKSADEIKDALSLPSNPTQFSLAEIPSQLIIRESIAAKVWKEGAYWGNGGARQFHIQGYKDIGEDIVIQWFSKSQNLNNILK